MNKLVMIPILLVLVSTVSVSTISAQSQYEIPSWIKGLANFWIDDKITDKDFVDAITYLIDHDVIKVSKIAQLENKIEQLDIENKQLVTQLNEKNEIPQESIISATIERSSYKNQERVAVSGKVYDYENNQEVSFVINDPAGNLIKTGKLYTDSTGMFSHSFDSGGPLWAIPGTYSIQYNYQDTSKEIAFQYDNAPDTMTEFILITTDTVRYHTGDTIEVTGTVSEFLEGTPVGIRVYDPSGELVNVGMIDVNPDNTFVAKLTADMPIFDSSGIYKIKVIHGDPSRNTHLKIEYLTPPPGVKSISLEKPLYFPDEQFVFTGLEDNGNHSVFVIIRDSAGNYVDMITAESNDDGTFDTVPEPVSKFFTKKGTYTALAYTDEQNAPNGVSIKLEFDGSVVSESG